MKGGRNRLILAGSHWRGGYLIDQGCVLCYGADCGYCFIRLTEAARKKEKYVSYEDGASELFQNLQWADDRFSAGDSREEANEGELAQNAFSFCRRQKSGGGLRDSLKMLKNSLETSWWFYAVSLSEAFTFFHLYSEKGAQSRTQYLLLMSAAQITLCSSCVSYQFIVGRKPGVLSYLQRVSLVVRRHRW